MCIRDRHNTVEVNTDTTGRSKEGVKMTYENLKGEDCKFQVKDHCGNEDGEETRWELECRRCQRRGCSRFDPADKK